MGSFVRFYKFLAKYFILSALASYLIFTGNKLATSGCILQNSNADRSEELMERVIDRFILTPCLSSYRVLLLQVLISSCEIPLPLFLCFKIGGLFERATLYFPSWMILGSLLNQIVSLICFLELRDLAISSSYVDPNNISSVPVYSVALCFRFFFSLLCSPNFCEGIIHKTNSLLQITQRLVLVQPNIFSLPNLKIFASAKNCWQKIANVN